MRRYAITSLSICTITIRGRPTRQAPLLWPRPTERDPARVSSHVSLLVTLSALIVISTRNRVLTLTFLRMVKKRTAIEVIEQGDERILLKTFDDGSEERRPIVKEPRKKRRRRIDWSRKLSTGLKRGF